MPSNQNPVYTDDTLTGDGTVEAPLSVAGGGGGAPGGASGDVQFNNAGAFGNADDIFPGWTFDIDGSGDMNIVGPSGKTLAIEVPGGEISIESNLVGICATFNSGGVTIGNSVGSVGFFQNAGTGQPTITGSRGGNAALASLLTAFAAMGLIVDGTTV